MRQFIISLLVAFSFFGLYTSVSAATPSDYDQELLHAIIEEDATHLEEQLSSIDNEYEVLNVELSEDQIDEMEAKKLDAVNQVGVVFLTEGFSELDTSTFKEAKTISIEAPEGTTLAVIVYNSDDSITFEEVKHIGASNMCDLNIPLELDLNRIILVVDYDKTLAVREYKINRKSKDTKNNLEELNIILIPMEETDLGG